MRDLLSYEGEASVEDVFCLNFAVDEDDFGQVITAPLKPGGENIPVTKENREEYVKLYCDFKLNKSVERFYKAFHAGFHKVCGGRVLDLFHARELMALVVGTTNYDWTEWQNQTEYKVCINFYFFIYSGDLLYSYLELPFFSVLLFACYWPLGHLI